MIVFSVKGKELFKGKAGDHYRVSTGIETIGVIGKERSLGILCQDTVRGRIGPLHFVEDNALIDKRMVLFPHLKMPALLLKDELGDLGIKDCVKVYINEVVEVLYVLAGHGVACLVGKGHGVQESMKGPF
jgi:hypothetical protein